MIKKTPGMVTAISPFVVALCFTAFVMCTEIRIPVGSLHISLGEFGAAAALVLGGRRARLAGGLAVPAFVALSAVSILSIFLAQGHQLQIAAARNLILPAALLLVVSRSVLQPNEIASVLWSFVAGAVIDSALAIQQAFMGSPPAFSIYQTRGFVDMTLHDVMGWKLYMAQTSRLIPGQRALGFGLHLFSNNFGEFVVYAMVAVLTLWGMRKTTAPVVAGLLALLGFALLTSLSRTSWAGALLVLAIFAFVRARSIIYRIALGVLAVGGALLMSDSVQSFLGFDRGGTLRGRAELNHIATAVFQSADVSKVMLGGLAPAYWSYSGAYSYPHNSFIYLVINVGAVGCLLAMFGIAGVAWGLGIAVVADPHDKRRAAALGGLLATAWLFAYSMTWTPLANSDSTFQWAILAGLGLSTLIRGNAPAAIRSTAPARRMAYTTRT